jgi:20S proteasome alpha/beta subunit
MRMKGITLAALLAIGITAQAETIYQVDPSGQVRYDKPALKMQGNKLYQMDPNGQVRYDKPSYVIKP